MFDSLKIDEVVMKEKNKNRNKKMRILYLHPDLGAGGGAEELRLTILKYINVRKYDIRLCCLAEKGELGREIEDLGFFVDVMGTSQRLFNFTSLFLIFNYLRKHKFDIVQTCRSVPNLYGRLAAMLAKVPYIISEEHCYYERYNPNFGYLFKIMNKILSRYTYKIITCSDAVKQRIAKEERINEDKFLTLHNAIDIKRFVVDCSKEEARLKLGLNPHVPVIGFVSTLAVRKGHSHLLQAMRLILYSYPEAKLLIVGQGPLRQKLEAFVERYDLNNSVYFLGLRRDIPLILKAMDIFISPAIKEAFGINLIEAMYSGLPCIATNVGGVPEVVKDNETGILVPPSNPQALAKAAKELLDKPDLAKRFGAAGRRRVLEHFTADKYIEKLENLYDGLLN